MILFIANALEFNEGASIANKLVSSSNIWSKIFWLKFNFANSNPIFNSPFFQLVSIYVFSIKGHKSSSDSTSSGSNSSKGANTQTKKYKNVQIYPVKKKNIRMITKYIENCLYSSSNLNINF